MPTGSLNRSLVQATISSSQVNGIEIAQDHLPFSATSGSKSRLPEVARVDFPTREGEMEEAPGSGGRLCNPPEGNRLELSPEDDNRTLLLPVWEWSRCLLQD